MRPAILVLLTLLLGAQTQAQTQVQAQTQTRTQKLTLSCAVVYTPARSTWVRQVEIDWDDTTVHAVRIDQLTPHAFSVQADGVLTAIDNERIHLDLRQRQWTSDFRGLSTGRGRCEDDDR